MRQTFAELDESEFGFTVPPKGVSKPPRFIVRSAAEVSAMPATQWAIRHVFPVVGLATIYGPSGSGKSFLAFDMTAIMGEAGSFFGHGVPSQLRVVILCLEAAGGVPQRVKAWEVARGRPFPKNVSFVFDAFSIMEGGDVSDLVAAIEACGGADVLLIDTLNQCMAGADENAARDAGQVIANLGFIQRALDCLVIAVHHAGKDESRGMRGHSSLHAAMDAVIAVTRNSISREWSLVKSKDGQDGQSHPFTLEVVEVGTDFMGDPITSCVVRSIDAPTERAPRPPTSRNQKIVYDALTPLLMASTDFGKASAPPTRPCLELELVVEQVKGRIAAEPRRQAARVREAITGMVASGVLGFNEGWLWLK